jgi:hypothetical protein
MFCFSITHPNSATGLEVYTNLLNLDAIRYQRLVTKKDTLNLRQKSYRQLDKKLIRAREIFSERLDEVSEIGMDDMVK